MVLKTYQKVTAHSLKRGQAEAIEIIAKLSDNPENIVGKDTPEGTVIISNDEKIKIAHHDVKIEENDHLIVFFV